MKKSILTVCTMFALLISPSGKAQEDVSKANQGDTYKTLFRHEIDVIGGKNKDETQRVNSHEYLSNGLNKLAEEGWMLVAVEGGRSVPAGGGRYIFPPVYIFTRSFAYVSAMQNDEEGVAHPRVVITAGSKPEGKQTPDPESEVWPQ